MIHGSTIVAIRDVRKLNGEDFIAAVKIGGMVISQPIDLGDEVEFVTDDGLSFNGEVEEVFPSDRELQVYVY